MNVTMVENLLQHAGRVASEQGVTRSGLLIEAVCAWLRESRLEPACFPERAASKGRARMEA